MKLVELGKTKMTLGEREREREKVQNKKNVKYDKQRIRNFKVFYRHFSCPFLLIRFVS